jgi:schlafen family protein
MLPRILLRNPHDWTLAEVRQLIDERIPEGQRIDYKAELHLDSKAQKAEAAKDVSGMANAQGGWLIFGVAEDESPEPLPVALTPLPAAGLQTRLENILDSALEPVPSYEAVSIAAENGVVIALRVAKTKGPPVMVQGYGQNRYFVRAGTRTRPMNATEVAKAHAAASRQGERVIERLDGLPLVATIGPGFRPIPMDNMEATPVACVVVAAIDGSAEPIGRAEIQPHAFEESGEGYRAGRRVHSGRTWTINAFGLLDEERLAPPSPSAGVGGLLDLRQVDPDDDRLKVHRVGIYRSGVVEWAHRYPQEQVIPYVSLADDVHNVLLYAARIFELVGYLGRLQIWVRVEHAAKAALDLPLDWDQAACAPGVDELESSHEVSTEDLLSDPTPTVRAAMDALWQGFGIARCLLFDAEGNWAD